MASEHPSPDPESGPEHAPADPLVELRSELAALEAVGLRRTLRRAVGPVAPEMEVDGRQVVNFCSNSYLDLAAHPALIAAARAAMDAEGVGAGAARLVGGGLEVHRALEAAIARWKGTEAALLFGAGYQANLGILTALAGAEDAIFSDQLNHASVIDGARLSRAAIAVYPHNDLDALDQLLARSRHLRRRVIVTESVFSMEGDVAPLPELVALARQHGALLVVDEAHATGVLGAAGAGLAAGLGVHVQMGTLGKALGGSGAYVAGPREVIDLLVNKGRSFVFTTAPPVPMVAAAAAALELVVSIEGDRRRAALWSRATRLREGLGRLGRPAIPGSPGHIVPWLVGDSHQALAASAALFERGLFVQAIRPPTVPDGAARLRITLMATHSDEQIDRLLEALAELPRPASPPVEARP